MTPTVLESVGWSNFGITVWVQIVKKECILIPHSDLLEKPNAQQFTILRLRVAAWLKKGWDSSKYYHLAYLLAFYNFIHNITYQSKEKFSVISVVHNLLCRRRYLTDKMPLEASNLLFVFVSLYSLHYHVQNTWVCVERYLRPASSARVTFLTATLGPATYPVAGL